MIASGLIYKQTRQDLALFSSLFERYMEKCFTQVDTALYGDAIPGPLGVFESR